MISQVRTEGEKILWISKVKLTVQTYLLVYWFIFLLYTIIYHSLTIFHLDIARWIFSYISKLIINSKLSRNRILHITCMFDKFNCVSLNDNNVLSKRLMLNKNKSQLNIQHSFSWRIIQHFLRLSNYYNKLIFVIFLNVNAT